MPRVLVIEDNADFREAMEIALRREGFTVATARDGEQGMRMQRSDPADVVVTDIFMPGKDGIETIAELRQAFPQTRIVAISGGGARVRRYDYLALAQDLGAVKLLRKPFALHELLEAVRKLS